MILYLTSQQHTNLLDFLTEQTDALPIKKMTGNFMLKQFVIYDMRNFSHCTELVLDRDAFGDDDIHFAEAIEEFLTMYNARITVICEGLQESAPLCHDLLEAGVGNIVTAEEIGAIQNEIRQSLSGQGMTRCKPKERTKPQEKEKLYQFATEGVRITMVSSQSRIGTTTMALGLTAWLGSVGASVAYVEHNSSGMIPYQIVNTYLHAFHNTKKKNYLKWFAWGAYGLFQYQVMVSTAGMPLLILIINIVLVFSIYKFSYHVNTKTALFLSGILYSVWMLVEVVTNNLLLLTDIKDNLYFFVVGSTVSKVAMYIAVHMVKSYRKSNLYTDMPFHYWLRLFLIPLATFYIIHNTYLITSSGADHLFFTVTTILMLMINYITFDIYDRLGNHAEMEKRNLAYEQQIVLCNRQAMEREEAYQNTRRIRHDLNSYLVDLKAAIQYGKLDEASSKIDDILDSNKIYKNEISRTGNLVIDSLINYKFSLAQKEGIDMKCYVFVPDRLPFDGADLCIILGNLLDNAMEAVGCFPTGHRYMSVSVTLVKGSLSIMVENPYQGEVMEDSASHIVTSKQDKKNHGIGLDSVQRTVKKYNGELLLDYENGLFKATVLLYPPEKLHGDS